MVEFCSKFLNGFVNYAEIILNFFAVFTVVRAVILGLIKQKSKKGIAKHIICKGISEALNYNLATEVMKIIAGREIKELGLIGGLLILKAMITGLFILEIKQDEMREGLRQREEKIEKDEMIISEDFQHNF